MKKLLHLWQNIRYSLWLIPAMIVAAALILAALAIEFDASLGSDALAQWPRLFGAQADGARSMLEAIASAMITIASLTFSITIVVLSLAASQYTPRVIRTFMGSRSTKVVLGIFLGVFAYCLVVLRSIRGGGEAFIPSVSVTIAMFLALLGVGVLVYFIHHIATSIQASTVISSIANETLATIDALFTEPLDSSATASKENCEDALQGTWHPVPSQWLGYLQTIDIEGLIDTAQQYDVMLKLEKKTGDFISPGQALLFVNQPPDQEIIDALSRRFEVGHYRTVEQDIGVGIRQLVDIALRALSPALNDPATAFMCIDFLSAILARLASRRIDTPLCFRDGDLRLIASGPDFDSFLAQAFDAIRENAKDIASVHLRLMRSLETLGELTADDARRRSIARHVQLAAEYARQHLTHPLHIAEIETYRLHALAACNR